MPYVGEGCRVYTVDSAADRLRVDKPLSADRANITLIHANLENKPLAGQRVDWVDSRFLLIHVADLDHASAEME